MKPSPTHWNVQQGKLGKPFRYTSTLKGNSEKWIDRELKSDWYYIYKYEDGSMFALHEDFNGKVIEQLDHKKVCKLLGID